MSVNASALKRSFGRRIEDALRRVAVSADAPAPIRALRRALARCLPRLAQRVKTSLAPDATPRSESPRPEIAAAVGSNSLFDRSVLDAARETVLLVSHDASRTGAPILAYNIAKRLAAKHNVVVLCLGAGDLVEDFRDCCAAVVGPIENVPLNPPDADYLVQRLLQSCSFSYALVNSIASRVMLRPLALAGVPVVALVHEFASYMLVREEMGPTLSWATQIVFSAELTAAAAREDYPKLDARPVHILRQGQPDLPERLPLDHSTDEAARIRCAMRPDAETDPFVVLGVGTVDIRKGVDLFLSCAGIVAARATGRPVRFVWIGNPRPGTADVIYMTMLQEQVARSGLKDIVAFVEEVADLAPAYDLADLFFMSSRLDPLPNVAIEAAMRGLPLVCFEKATGIAEVLAQDETTRAAAVPHLDIAAAADLIAGLAADRNRYDGMSRAVRGLAKRAFDMDAYVERLDALGHESMDLLRQREEDFATISADPLFDVFLYIGRARPLPTRDEAIRDFLVRAAAYGLSHNANFSYRRPCPGFHPQIYEFEQQAAYDRKSINALAHYIRNGKPQGCWGHPVIGPSDPDDGAGSLRVALHAHFHYPELADEFLRRWSSNRSAADLFFSTDREEKAELLRRAAEGYERGRVTVGVAPNRGRDLGPFVTLFGREILASYDVVGHVHGKRSLFLDDKSVGEAWREFLWQNLLGDHHRMADIILGHFRRQPELGLVFPGDPHLCDWDANLQIATGLAARMGMPLPLPPFFDFPVGAMFWARTSALKPLLELPLDWADYPAEPAPIDGTILHAIERLLPVVARHCGFGYTTTHVPGSTW